MWNGRSWVRVVGFVEFGWMMAGIGRTMAILHLGEFQETEGFLKKVAKVVNMAVTGIFEIRSL